MIRSHIRRDAHGDPVLTIRVTGAHDMYRVAEHLATAQSDIQPHGRRVFPYLWKFLGGSRFTAFDKSMNNGWAVERGLHRRQRRGL
ncbi:hypothetical protein OHA01_26215 [Micromonospora zamorensis]|uniref:hypothetical protein n=1 Tax=Micromonospora zamorensis TaxID=709883 RepID=UPI003863DC9E|nr:hypothetical protein OHA01_26215 [Micromonospora zamorensis]